ncbi:phosphatase PAP2 family protein [Pseudoduganella sp. GCM10020061]|uniref:phosphatase PAP2 family protein n=1 Tax=Pseudoduganella sp. GCM10020061 TaxID=3317345 RepID=UPI00362F97E9
MLERVYKWLAARLTPGEETGLHLTAGVLLMLFMGWIFAEIAEEVVEGEELVAFDTELTAWVFQNHHPWLTKFMFFITHWHTPLGVLAMAAVLGVWLWRRRERYWLAALVLTVPVGMALNLLLKYLFQRERPQFDEPLLTLATYSFPSGHASAAALFYGFLVAYLVRSTARKRWWALGAALAGLMVLLVAASRVYLGAHYLSDVLAAIAEGWMWLTICITAISTLRRRRQRLASRSPS